MMCSGKEKSVGESTVRVHGKNKRTDSIVIDKLDLDRGERITLKERITFKLLERMRRNKKIEIARFRVTGDGGIRRCIK